MVAIVPRLIGCTALCPTPLLSGLATCTFLWYKLLNRTVMVGGRQRHALSYLQDFLFAPKRARTPVKALSGGVVWVD